MKVQSLGYLGFSGDLTAWRSFGTRMLGMQESPTSEDVVYLRMDERRHRILVEPGPDAACFYGWEMDDAKALAEAAGELDRCGLPVHEATSAELDTRQVAGMVWVRDPDGNRVELFQGPSLGDGEFTPGADITGFVTGELGLGHVVLATPDVAPMARFYEDVLGFRLSDFMTRPVRMRFLHTNPRHHSVALFQSPAPGLQHFMIEARELDDVGIAFDRTQELGVKRVSQLGRHSNDGMFSFYARNPAGTQTEFGWGGKRIDPGGWQANELAGATIWGYGGGLGALRVGREAGREGRS